MTYRPLNWERPDTGWVAVSVQHLVGMNPPPWLWHLQPRALVGKSIWLYYVEK